MRILIVDDNKLTLELLQTKLEQAGHEVATASTAAEALAQRAVWRPDAVVLDALLPDHDGVELLRRLRGVSAREGLPSIPVVLATALAGDELERVRAGIASLGPARLLRKPFDLAELLCVLEEMTGGAAP